MTNYIVVNGAIRDMRIRVNTYFTWAIDGRGNAYDVQNALTHEFGHGLPLLHSTYSAATMWGYTGIGETFKRSLHFDDIDGIRAIY